MGLGMRRWKATFHWKDIYHVTTMQSTWPLLVTIMKFKNPLVRGSGPYHSYQWRSGGGDSKYTGTGDGYHVVTQELITMMVKEKYFKM